MTTIGLIGAGNIGTTVARLAVRAGHDVVLSNSRGPHTLQDLVGTLGPRARAGTTADAARAGDLVVVTIPLHALTSLDPALLAGATVVDTLNHYPDRDGEVPALAQGTTTSRLVQEHLAGSVVVKAFNSIYAEHLAALPRPAGAADRSALPVAGDDPAATARVAALLDDLGYDALDAGGLDDSWRFERGMPAYCLPYAADPQAFAASAPGARPQEASPAGTAVIRAALAEADGVRVVRR